MKAAKAIDDEIRSANIFAAENGRSDLKVLPPLVALGSHLKRQLPAMPDSIRGYLQDNPDRPLARMREVKL